MAPYRRKAYIALFLLFTTRSGAVNFTQCLVDVTNCAIDPTAQNCTLNISNTTALSVLRTSDGSPITSVSELDSPETATAISLDGCATFCGRSQEPFNWSVFSQEYSAWLLPYLALISQLPFGDRRRTDNLMSAILTLGSPTLAGYSLYLTILNARWLKDPLFAQVHYPSRAIRDTVVRVLSDLQQVPVRIRPGRFESLVVHPDNDQWWSTFAAELDYSHTWSIASATSITWVVIAYLLTVADSFSNVGDHINSNGQGTGSVWLWLLPIVVGWLILSPKCDVKRVHDAYDKANKQVFVPHPSDPYHKTILVNNNFGLTINPSPGWELLNRNICSPDESRITPVFNYARALSWSRTAYRVSLFYQKSWGKANDGSAVNGDHISENVHNDVPRAWRLGNSDQIVGYCSPSDREYNSINTFWLRGVLFNMIVASLVSLFLQWGTTTAAVLVVWYTPTIGLGCRSLAYVIYGGISTAVWLLLVLSNALGYFAHCLVSDPLAPDLESDGQPTPSPHPTHPTPLLVVNSTGNDSGPPGSSVGIATNDIPTIPSMSQREMMLNFLPGDTGNGSGPSNVECIALEEIRTTPSPLRYPAALGADDTVHSSGTSYADGASSQPLLEVAGGVAQRHANEDEPANPYTTRYSRSKWIHVPTLFLVADLLRWTGKFLAVINAIGIIANSVFQYAGVYDTCYCDSSVFTWGSAAFNIINPNSNDIELASRAWIGALTLALTSCTMFVGTIYLIRDPGTSY